MIINVPCHVCDGNVTLTLYVNKELIIVIVIVIVVFVSGSQVCDECMDWFSLILLQRNKLLRKRW